MVIGLIVLGMVPLGIDEIIRFFKSEKFLKGSDINYDSGSNGFKNHRQKSKIALISKPKTVRFWQILIAWGLESESDFTL